MLIANFAPQGRDAAKGGTLLTVQLSLRPEQFGPELTAEGLRPRGSPKFDN